MTQNARALAPRPRSRGQMTLLVRSAIGTLGGLALINSVWPVWRSWFPMEIDVNESWNSFHADAFIQGLTLYPDKTSLIVNNYPPLSYYLIGYLSLLSWDAVAIGRTLSLMALAAICAAIAVCIRSLGGSRCAALVACLWYWTTMVRFNDAYVGMNDPQLPALAISLTGLAWYVSRQQRQRSAIAPIMLMALAGFYKHTLIAAPLTTVLHLARRDFRAAVLTTAAGLTVAGVGLALCTLVYGKVFIAQLMMARALSLSAALESLAQLQFILPAMLIWGVWAWSERKTEASRFTTIHIAVSFVVFFLQKMGDGVDKNATFDLMAATAIGLGISFSRAEVSPFGRRFGLHIAQATILGLLLVRLLLSNHLESYYLLARADYRREFSENAAVFEQEVVRIRSIPGPVSCTLMTVCRRAGKTFVYDSFAMSQRVKTGVLTANELTAEVAARMIRFEPIDSRAATKVLQRKVLAFAR